ncbi:polysaccharide biosynthesis protein [Thioalkalivibrio versutus]|uniref:Polysaccharide biosynthesis protein n=1 Tax=Thioalkalivibrio versutus TaxID=106634 RepID=A0A0G3G0R4_9GAMM|nr:UDP-2,4-diacetamido-2,4,6-trideoxy-beta-L-altropyranose hydrolase [Thioalkalivibrio versutus]AKJ94785.1 polysaccharide biosynthesis protein [Thioalkalivibrio versutus]
MTQTVVFRADASVEIGTGHVMRCLTLADALRERGHACHFICRDHPGNLIEVIGQRGFPVHTLSAVDDGAGGAAGDEPGHAHWLGTSWEIDARQSRAIIRDLDPAWLVVDHYALDARWEVAVKSQGLRLLVIDDLADRSHEVNLLLDQNLGRESSDYFSLVPESCRRLIGPRYALLRPEFARLREDSLRRRHSPRLKRVLVTMGGVDKDNATGKVLDALQNCPLPGDAEIEVVMGSNAPWLESVREQAATMPRKTTVRVDVRDMAMRMVDADLAIGAAGSTSWERCCLGVPAVMVVLAENQKSIAEALAKVGACVYLGDVMNVDQLPDYWGRFSEPRALEAMSKASAAVTDGQGVVRLCQQMGDKPNAREFQRCVASSRGR